MSCVLASSYSTLNKPGIPILSPPILRSGLYWGLQRAECDRMGILLGACNITGTMGIWFTFSITKMRGEFRKQNRTKQYRSKTPETGSKFAQRCPAVPTKRLRKECQILHDKPSMKTVTVSFKHSQFNKGVLDYIPSLILRNIVSDKYHHSHHVKRK